jgi:hypothetical protein
MEGDYADSGAGSLAPHHVVLNGFWRLKSGAKSSEPLLSLF